MHEHVLIGVGSQPPRFEPSQPSALCHSFRPPAILVRSFLLPSSCFAAFSLCESSQPLPSSTSRSLLPSETF